MEVTPQRRCLLRLAAATLAMAQTLSGQHAPRPATLNGVVSDRSTGAAVPHAQIVLLDNSRSVSVDSTGRFAFSGLPIGVSQFTIRALGFHAITIVVEFAEGQIVQRAIVLDSTEAERTASDLPAISIRADAPVFDYRLTDFERRRRTGRGQYLTEDDIIRSGAYNVADAVKHMRGVDYKCDGTTCYVRMFRAPMRCLPEYIVDGRPMNDFGPSTPIRDVVGVEVYMGPSDVPGEYAGTSAGCGVIVLWTRSGPTRKKD